MCSMFQDLTFANCYSFCSSFYRFDFRAQFVNAGRGEEVHQQDGERAVGHRAQADCYAGLGLQRGRHPHPDHHGGQ